MQPGVQSDLFGDFALVSIDRSIYSDAAIFKTAYWFTDRFFIFLDQAGSERITVEIRQKDLTGTDSLEDACREFCNSLIDHRVRDIVLKETGAIREALVLRAFSEGVPKPGFPGVISKEVGDKSAQET